MAEVTPEQEGFIRREIQKQLANAAYGQFGAPAVSYKPEEWDFQVIKANEFPGHGYELHQFVSITNDVYAIWRINRAKAMTIQGYKPILKLPNQ